MADLKEKLKLLPEKSGCYIMYDADRNILYIGKAKVLKNRVKQYFQKQANRTQKVSTLMSKVVDFDYIITNNEIEALVLENNLIKKHKPPYNILLKDDKEYPFIKINLKKKFPKPEVCRRLVADGSKYFGPYMVGISAREIQDLISAAFGLRTCNLDMDKIPKNHRPCLNFHIGSIFMLFILVFAKILLYYKGFRNFFSQSYGFLHLILYFCALEMVPLSLLVKGILYINQIVILNF